MSAISRVKARASGRLDELRARWPWLDTLVRGIGRHQRTEASVAAVQIAYTAFFSIFPLLFVAVGVLGIVLRGDPELETRILDAVKDNFPGDLSQLVSGNLQRAQSSAAASVGIGLVLLLYSGTGMVVAIQRGLNRAFGVEHPAGAVVQRARALGWLATVGLVLGISVAAGSLLGAASGAVLDALGVTGGLATGSARVLGFVVSFAIDVAMFTLTFTLLPHRRLSPRQVLPGAVVGALWWGVLKSLGAWYVKRAVTGAAAVFGPLAVVVGLLVFVNLAAQLLLLTASVMAEALERDERVAAAQSAAATAAAPPVERAPGRRKPLALGVLLGWLIGRGVRRRNRRAG